jgi:hypothetical protein
MMAECRCEVPAQRPDRGFGALHHTVKSVPKISAHLAAPLGQHGSAPLIRKDD